MKLCNISVPPAGYVILSSNRMGFCCKELWHVYPRRACPVCSFSDRMHSVTKNMYKNIGIHDYIINICIDNIPHVGVLFVQQQNGILLWGTAESYMKKVTFKGGHRGQRELRQESLVHLTSKNPPTQQPFFSGKKYDSEAVNGKKGKSGKKHS